MNHFVLPSVGVDREKFIIEECTNKRVLHLGCADWPFTEGRIQDGTWLHYKLSTVARTCLGVDDHGESVVSLSNDYGINNIIVGDAERLGELDIGKFEVVVAGEIIEHLNNPGLLFESVKNVLEEDGKLLITTINAYCLRRFVRIPFGRESVHPDHVYYFSHSTLMTLATRFGFILEGAYSYKINNRKPYLPYVVERLATMITPNWGEGIVHLYSNRSTPTTQVSRPMLG